MRMVFTKFDGSLHWHFGVEHLGEDEHGLWLGVSAETPMQRGHEPPVGTEGFVLLVPRDGWWIACFNLASDVEVYVDVTTPPQVVDDEVRAVDLDLDVIRGRDGGVVIDDEDEFADHQLHYEYPDDVIRSAEKTAAWLVSAVSERREPFDRAAERWLAQLRAAPGR